jgi:hypothetical protein
MTFELELARSENCHFGICFCSLFSLPTHVTANFAFGNAFSV